MMSWASKLLKRGRKSEQDLVKAVAGAVTSRRPSLSPTMAPTVALAAGVGVGVAFWWWTQWARGRAESAGAESCCPETPSDAAGAPEGVAAVIDPAAQDRLAESVAVQADGGEDGRPAAR